MKGTCVSISTYLSRFEGDVAHFLGTGLAILRVDIIKNEMCSISPENELC